MRRLVAILLLPLIALDCIGCLVLGGSWRNTISGESWNNRHDKQWGKARVWIDRLFRFQPNHCEIQANREAEYGSVWRAWLVEFRG